MAECAIPAPPQLPRDRLHGLPPLSQGEIKNLFCRNQNVFQNADLVEPFGKHLVQLVVRRFAFSSDGRQLNHVEGSTPFPGIVVLFNAAPKPLLPAVRVAVRSLNQMLGVEFLLGFLKGGAVKIRENATEGLVFPGRFKVALTRRN